MIKLRTLLIPVGKICLFFQNGKIEKLKIIKSGVYKFWDVSLFSNYWFIIDISEQNAASSILEAFTKENLDLKYNYSFTFKILEPVNLLKRFGFTELSNSDPVTEKVRTFLLNKLNEISKIPFNEISINEVTKKKVEISDLISNRIIEIIKQEKLEIEFKNFMINTVMMPVSIQKLIASEVENEMKSKMELEAARTKVAVARTLKNAADLLRNDSVSMELKKLEVLEKIGQKGKTQIIFKMNEDKKDQ